MIGSNKRAQVTDAITRTVGKAGGLVTAALAIAGAALLVALVALAVAVKNQAAPGMRIRPSDG